MAERPLKSKASVLEVARALVREKRGAVARGGQQQQQQQQQAETRAARTIKRRQTRTALLGGLPVPGGAPVGGRMRGRRASTAAAVMPRLFQQK